MRNVTFEHKGFEDIEYWLKNDRKILKRILDLIKDIKRSPFSGLGKPEPLKHEMAGCWSRRINDEHRLVYYIKSDTVIILSCRLHYR